MAVITIWKQYVVSTELVVMVAAFLIFLFDHLMKLLSPTLHVPSPEGSGHSNDSLSDASPPAAGVPTQVVQPVQTTPQVRRAHIHKPYEFVISQ